MSEGKWLNGYSGQTTDELLRLDGPYRTESIVLAFEQAIDLKAYHRGSGSVSAEEQVLLAVEALEREVNNGGYSQFFLNSSKEYAPIVVDALNRIGCGDAALLTQRAIEALGIGGPMTVEAIDLAMERDNGERDAKLQECDERYYGVVGCLAAPLLEFVRRNRDKFVIG